MLNRVAYGGERIVLERHGRNVAAAAETAGLDRTYVYRLIRKHDL